MGKVITTETLFLICDSIITGFFSLCYLYQVFFVIFELFKRKRPRKNTEPEKLHSFGVIICARNEQSVIGGLIDSIKRQNYPSELVDIFVVADNCCDYTAKYAEASGATVFERNNQSLIGKGYALDFAFKTLFEQGIKHDAYLIFDADNLVDRDFIKEMNLKLCDGYKVLTSYRNSKNYGTNWITSGYSLSFIREASYLNKAREDLKLSCAISGTGFCVKREIIEKNGGWKHHLLTEDIEFTVDSVIQGEKFGISEKSVLFDEQPVTFKSSWNQRMRWAKGFYQILGMYGGKLLKRVFTGSFTCYDFFMTLFPASAYTVYCLIKAIAESLREPLPIPVVYNCGGYESISSLKLLEGKIDIYLPDLKYADNTLAIRYSVAPDYFETATEAIKEMYRQTGNYIINDDGIMTKGVIIRHLILPGQLENTKRVIDWVKNNFKEGQILFSLMSQYTPIKGCNEDSLNRRLNQAEYDEIQEYLFDSGIEDGFMQELSSASEEYVPPFELGNYIK